MNFVISLLLTAVVGGGAAMAETTEPGDSLYFVKTGVNEKVSSWFTFSEQADARFEMRLMERRLREAEELAADGELTAGVSQDTIAHVGQRVAQTQEYVAQLESSGKREEAAEIQSNLEAALRAHGTILSHIASNTDADSRINVEPIIEKVNAAAQDTARIRLTGEAMIGAHATTSATTSPDVQAAAEGRLTAAKNKIDEVQKYVDRNADRVRAQVVAEARTRIESAEEAMVEGEARLEAQAYSQAFSLFQKAHRIAQEAKVLIKTDRRLKLNAIFGGDAEADQQSTATSSNQSDSDNQSDATTTDQEDESGQQSEDGSAAEVRADVRAESESEVETGSTGAGASGSTEGSAEIEL